MNRRNYLYLFVLLALSSCFEPFEDFIYEDSQPLTVIEAHISNGQPPYMVKISKSVNPGEDLTEAYINNAIIKIKNNVGDSMYFQPLGDGNYYLSKLKGQSGLTYRLQVFIEDQSFVAIEKMPQPPLIDSLGYAYLNNYLDGSGYYFTLFMKKRKDTVSYFKVDITMGDSLFNDYADLFFFDDTYTLESYEILLPYAFNVSDSVTVDVYGITKNMYDYYYGLSNQTTNLFSNIQPPMFNPPSNFSNNALGYFQAASVLTLHRTVIEKRTR